MIHIRLRSGNAKLVCDAILDNGFDVTLMRSDCLKSFGLKEDQASVVVQTVDDNRTT